MIRTAKAHWSGNLKEGKGTLTTPSNILSETNYSFKTRFEDGASGTNPEELLAAAPCRMFYYGRGSYAHSKKLIANFFRHGSNFNNGRYDHNKNSFSHYRFCTRPKR